MPFESVVPAPAIIYDHQITWPFPYATDTLTAVLGAPIHRGLYRGIITDDGITNNQLFVSNAASGSGSFRIVGALNTVTQSFPCGRLDSPTAGHFREVGAEGLSAIGSTLQTTLPAGAAFPSATRVYQLETLLRYVPIAGATPAANLAGLVIMPQNAPLQGWPTNVVGATNRGGMGIVADGAGQWTYRSFNRAGVALVRETVPLPAHTMDAWNRVLFQFIFDRPGLPATFELWWNGSLVLSRNWGGGLLEPIGTAGDLHEWNWVPHIRTDDQGQLAWTFDMKRGRFTAAGLEIQG